MKGFLFSAIMGVLALVLVNITAPWTGIALGINGISLGIGSFLGMPGVLTMLLLGFVL